jgi:hypothetical protein
MKLAVVLRILAGLGGLVAGLILLVLYMLADVHRLAPVSAIACTFSFVTMLAVLSVLFASWDLIAGRIFAVGSCIVLFAPLAYLLLSMLRYGPMAEKIYTNYLTTTCGLVVVGLLSPFICLWCVRLTKQFSAKPNPLHNKERAERSTLVS